MSGPTQNRNIIKPDPSLSDLITLMRKQIMLAINCHGIATVKSVDTTNQTVKATMNYKKTEFVRKTDSEEYTKRLIDYPVLVDVPFVVLNGGGFHINMPIKAGDTCLIIFNDRDMDNWFSSGSKTNGVATPRVHAFADAIALVGLNSEADAIEGYDPDNFQVTNGDVLFQLGANNKAKISNSSKNLKTILDDLINTVKGLKTLVTGGSSAGSYALDPSTTSGLDTAIADLGELLE